MGRRCRRNGGAAILSRSYGLVAARVRWKKMDAGALHEILLTGPFVLLSGIFLIGWRSLEPAGLPQNRQLHRWAPFKVCCACSLLDMGLVAGRACVAGDMCWRGATGLLALTCRLSRRHRPCRRAALGLSTGGVTLMAVLMRVMQLYRSPLRRCGWPCRANPSIYLTLSLGVTFLFNLTLGHSAIQWRRPTALTEVDT